MGVADLWSNLKHLPNLSNENATFFLKRRYTRVPESHCNSVSYSVPCVTINHNKLNYLFIVINASILTVIQLTFVYT